MCRVKRVKRVYLKLVIEEYRNVVLVILFISQILSVGITAAFVSQLEIKTVDIVNKEIYNREYTYHVTNKIIRNKHNSQEYCIKFPSTFINNVFDT